MVSEVTICPLLGFQGLPLLEVVMSRLLWTCVLCFVLTALLVSMRPVAAEPNMKECFVRCKETKEGWFCPNGSFIQYSEDTCKTCNDKDGDWCTSTYPVFPRHRCLEGSVQITFRFGNVGTRCDCPPGVPSVEAWNVVATGVPSMPIPKMVCVEET
jgi:hypothetical protein